MNNEDLKPCPFCGGEAHIFGHTKSWGILCTKCYVSTLRYETEAAAIAAWNRRVCVKQNAETLDTKSVASNQLNAKLTYAEIEKMVKPLEWELQCEGGDFVAKVGKVLFRISYWDAEEKYIVFCDSTLIQGGFALLDKAKHAAQKWLVELVAAALGVERSGK
ncbi:MAG: Lar family restriction alleviation protein [Opitutales bacterium]|nr:Lar family restriction alleviation protein [Opitutales bacterium]